MTDTYNLKIIIYCIQYYSAIYFYPPVSSYEENDEQVLRKSKCERQNKKSGVQQIQQICGDNIGFWAFELSIRFWASVLKSLSSLLLPNILGDGLVLKDDLYPGPDDPYYIQYIPVMSCLFKIIYIISNIFLLYLKAVPGPYYPYYIQYISVISCLVQMIQSEKDIVDQFRVWPNLASDYQILLNQIKFY